MKRKKITMVSGIIGPRFGGQGLSSLQLYRVLVEAGYDVTLVTLPRGFDPADLAAHVEPPGPKHHAVCPLNLYNWVDRKDRPRWEKVLWHGIDTWNPVAYRSFKRLFQITRPDAIVITRTRGFSAAVMSAAGRVCPGRVLRVVNDYETLAPDATLSQDRDPNGGLYRLFRAPYQFIRRRASRHVRVLVAPSRYTLKQHQRMGFFPRAAARVIPNTHGYREPDLDGHRKHPPAARPPRRFLFLGRLEPEKGISWLCRVFEDLARAVPDVRLDVAGWGTLESALVQTYGNRHWFRFHGRVTGQRKIDCLTAADVMVVPSRWPEVFGIVCLEAFVHGIPVIATRMGGLPEVVTDGVTGRLVDLDDRALFGALQTMTTMSSDAFRTTRRACFDAARRYTFEQFATAYTDTIESMLHPVPLQPPVPGRSPETPEAS